MSRAALIAPAEKFDTRGIAGIVLCCALWGANPVAVRFAVPDIPAFGCAGLRFLISLPFLAVIGRGSGAKLTVTRPLWGLVGLNALLCVLQIGTFNWGTSHSLAGRSSILINVHPLIVAPLSWLAFGERLGLRGIFGLGAAMLGIFALFADKLRPGGDARGDLVLVLSGLIFGVQTIVQKATFPKIPPTTLLFTQAVVAVPIFLVYSLAVEGPEAYHFTTAAILGVLYMGLGVSGLCFWTWFLLLRRYPANRLAAFAFLTPVFGVAFGNLAQGDPLTGPLLIGAAMVGAGIYLVASDRTAHGRAPDIGLPGDDAL